MATFRSKTTGRIVHTSDSTAGRYPEDRWVRLDEAEGVTGSGAPQVPDGTVLEVLNWVGNDPVRRDLALTAERAGKQRKGILEALT